MQLERICLALLQRCWKLLHVKELLKQLVALWALAIERDLSFVAVLVLDSFW